MRKRKKKSIPPEDPNQAAKGLIDFVINKTEKRHDELATYYASRGGIIITPNGWRIPTVKEQEEINMQSKQAAREGTVIVLSSPERTE